MGLFDGIRKKIADAVSTEVPAEGGETPPEEADQSSVDERLEELKRQAEGGGRPGAVPAKGRSTLPRSTFSQPPVPATQPFSRPVFNPFAPQSPSAPQAPLFQAPVQPQIPAISPADEAACRKEAESWLDPNQYKALNLYQKMEGKFGARFPDPNVRSAAIFEALSALEVQPEHVKDDVDRMMSVLRGHYQRLSEEQDARHAALLENRRKMDADVQQAIETIGGRLEVLRREQQELEAKLAEEEGKTAVLDEIQQVESGRIAGVRAFYQYLFEQKAATYETAATVAAGMLQNKG